MGDCGSVTSEVPDKILGYHRGSSPYWSILFLTKFIMGRKYSCKSLFLSRIIFGLTITGR